MSTRGKGRRQKKVAYPPPLVSYGQSTTRGGAHKLISFIMFLHVLKASVSTGSKKAKRGTFLAESCGRISS